jgi:hypothetical protein
MAIELLDQAVAPSGPARPYMPTKAAVEDWTTPLEVLEPVRRIFGGTIDFDPCGNPSSIVGAKRQVWLPKWCVLPEAPFFKVVPPDVIEGDGLELPWTGNTFINSPYDWRTLTAFMKRAREHADSGDSAILLTKVKTGLKGWQQHVPAAPAVCFIDGRLTFGGGGGESAPFDCALILWTRDRELVHRFAWYLDGKHGDVMFHLG